MGVEPGPEYREEVFVPGRQGHRAQRESNPACGSADLPWDHAPRRLDRPDLSRSLALPRRGAAWNANKTLKLTGAAITVSRGIPSLQAAPAA